MSYATSPRYPCRPCHAPPALVPCCTQRVLCRVVAPAVTVYEKGAEVVRLYDTLLGKEGFRKGER